MREAWAHMALREDISHHQDEIPTALTDILNLAKEAVAYHVASVKESPSVSVTFKDARCLPHVVSI